MKMPMMIIGIILLAIGGLMASGVFRYTDTDRVVDAGPLKIDSTKQKTTPPNWGYLLLAGGAVVLVVGAVAGKKS
jgi:hypothetical protein